MKRTYHILYMKKYLNNFAALVFTFVPFFSPFFLRLLPSPLGEELGVRWTEANAQSNRLWATYYGGSACDDGFSVATDASSNVYLAGLSTSCFGAIGGSGIASGGF